MLAHNVAKLHSMHLCPATEIGTRVTSRQACFCRRQKCGIPRHTATAEQPAGSKSCAASRTSKSCNVGLPIQRTVSTLKQTREAAASCCMLQRIFALGQMGSLKGLHLQRLPCLTAAAHHQCRRRCWTTALAAQFHLHFARLIGIAGHVFGSCSVRACCWCCMQSPRGSCMQILGRLR